MTYDNELTLISATITYDDIGNPIETPIETVVLCNVKSIGRTEFYNAAANGLKPNLIFLIHKYEYNGENLIEFEDIKYKVIKTYSTGIEEIELTCEKVIGNA